MMTQDDIATIEKIMQAAMQNTDFINKVWIAGAAVIVSIFAALVGSITQIFVAQSQRKNQSYLAEQQVQQQKKALADQLSVQELSSRRIANASVSAKRQVWIDELRKDIAKYLSLMQEISYRWSGILNQPRIGLISDEALENFKKPVAAMKNEALEIQLRIELRLNITEAKHKDLIRLMKTLDSVINLYPRAASSFKPNDIQMCFFLFRERVLVKTQEILKEEWERVKTESYADPNDLSYTARSKVDVQ